MKADHSNNRPQEIVNGLLHEFRENQWFQDQCWPENKHRVLLMLSDVLKGLPNQQAKVLDVGCANGYISYLFARSGFEVTATDSWAIPERDEMFARLGVQYFPSNLNDLKPLASVASEAFDALICGEVFEHILNHPMGLLQEFHRVLKRGGLLILTTPNPSTVMNAVRVLLDRNSMWGTPIFLEEPKIVDGTIIDKGEIHYREYTTSEVMRSIEAAGFTVEAVRYMGMGTSRKQPAAKRLLKFLMGNTLMRTRPFGCIHYFLASRPN
jgi:2-polyprenyl-3-methyl-5-hydroxy-6-metoxy-1,4-benzoquinol methylase